MGKDSRSYLSQESEANLSINTMQNYFGMKIWQNKGNLYQMSKPLGLYCATALSLKTNPTGINFVVKGKIVGITGKEKSYESRCTKLAIQGPCHHSGMES